MHLIYVCNLNLNVPPSPSVTAALSKRLPAIHSHLGLVSKNSKITERRRRRRRLEFFLFSIFSAHSQRGGKYWKIQTMVR